MLINSPNISGSLKVTGNTVITGSLTVLGGINATITGSATTASYVEYSNVANKPTLVSGSTQVSFNGITDKPTLVSGSAQVSFNGITDKPTLVSGSSQITYSGLSGIPSGIVSSSTQITGYNIFATTGSNVFQANQVITGSLFISQNLVVAGSSSIQYISSSVLDIADNIITVNAFNPAIRFGGLAVIDSGSSPQVSGSILFDSIKDQWIFVHQNQTVVTSSVLLMGPETYNDLGNESYISANRLPKGSGVEHLRDSNITDTGTVVSVNSNTQVTGSLGVTGSLAVNGTGSFLTNSNGFVARFTGGATGGVLGGFFANSTTGFASIGVQSNHEFRIFTNDTDRLTIAASTGAATFTSTVTATGNVRSINPGVDGTFADAFVGVLSTNNNETNGIQTSVSSVASLSGFRFQASNGGGSSGRTTIVDFLRDRAIFNTGVGIGTSAPDSGLNINSGATRALRIDTNAGIQGISMSPNSIFGIDEPGVGNGRFVINTSGNVGIGTTGPSTKLNVVGAATQGQGLLNISNTHAGGSVYYPAAKIRNTRGDHSYGIISEFSIGSTGGTDRPSILFYSDASTHSWNIGQVTAAWGTADSFGIGYRANNAPSTFADWPTNYFIITTGGNVGINNTSPTEGLVVARGALRVTSQALDFGAGTRGISIDTTGAGLGRIYTVSGTGTATDLAFGTNNTERMRITTGGDVNIKNGVITTGVSVSIAALNTDYILTPRAFSGLIVIRDNTNGGSGVWLADPNQGFIQIANNMPGTFTVSYSAPNTIIRKTSGNTINISVGLYSNILG